jgi:hypothetical protein
VTGPQQFRKRPVVINYPCRPDVFTATYELVES